MTITMGAISMRAIFPRRYALPVLHALLSIACVATLYSAGPAAAQLAEPIRVGVPLPQTGSASRWGTFSLRGATLAADQINKAGGVLGARIEIIKADDQCVPAEGVSATQRLINLDRVHLIFGPMCSSVAKALQPIVESAQIPMLLAATSDPEITYKAGVGGFKWTFRNYPTDEVRTLIVLDHAVKNGFKKFAIVTVDNDFGRSVVEYHKKYQSRFPGIEFTSVDFFSLKETDFRPVLAKIRSAGAEVVLLYATGGDTVQVLGRQMRELGLVGKVKLMGLGDLTHPDNVKALGNVLEGAVEATLWVPQWDNERSKKFQTDYQAMFNESPNFLAYSYWETMYLLSEAVKSAKSVQNSALQSALQSISYQGAMGKVTFDDHNQANLPMLLLEVKEGQVNVLGSHFTQPSYAK